MVRESQAHTLTRHGSQARHRPQPEDHRALFATGVTGVTAELTIRYLHSVDVNAPVEVRGWVKPSRHGVIPCGAELHQAGTLVVRAAAKFMAM